MPATHEPTQGHGVSIAFSSGFLAWITNVGISGFSREALPTTNSSTTVAHTHRPAVLYDGGTLTVDLQFNSSTSMVTPITGAIETVTITWPLAAGATTAATMSGSAFLTGFDITAPIGGIMTASAKLKFTGQISRTAAS